MKQIIKKLVLFAAVAGLAACSEEETADMSVEGIKGDFAYIVGGTEAMYQATSCEIFHTPDLEDGSVEMNLTVALTRAQSHDTSIELAVDASKISEGYEAVPDGLLRFENPVTIPAGEKSRTIAVSIAQEDFPQLTQPQYMAPFSIVAVNGVKISSNSNTAILIISTETIDPADNLINVEESVHTFSVKNYTNETVGDAIAATIRIEGSEAAYKGFEIEMRVDNTLIADYNEEHGTSYVALPGNVTLSLSTPYMETGATETSAEVSIADEERSKLTDENGYLVPVVVKDASPATLSPNCGVTYLVIDVVNFATSSDFFYALYLGDYRMSTWYQFQQPIDLSNGYTYVFHLFIDEKTRVARVGDFADINENWINMLRFGQKGDYDTRMEWFVGPNGCRKTLYTKALEVNTWYQIALVYTTEAYNLYVEGELQESYTLTDEDKAAMASLVSPAFQAIEFNSSWGENYRNGNEFHGRLWHMGVFNRALDESWIRNYCYHDFNPYLISSSYYGLCAYWGFDDGTGAVASEGTGRYESIDFTKTIRCDDESSMVPADVSPYIQWVADEYNNFD